MLLVPDDPAERFQSRVLTLTVGLNERAVVKLLISWWDASLQIFSLLSALKDTFYTEAFWSRWSVTALDRLWTCHTDLKWVGPLSLWALQIDVVWHLSSFFESRRWTWLEFSLFLALKKWHLNNDLTATCVQNLSLGQWRAGTRFVNPVTRETLALYVFMVQLCLWFGLLLWQHWYGLFGFRH